LTIPLLGILYTVLRVVRLSARRSPGINFLSTVTVRAAWRDGAPETGGAGITGAASPAIGHGRRTLILPIS